VRSDLSFGIRSTCQMRWWTNGLVFLGGFSYDFVLVLSCVYCMGTLTRQSWIHYTVCWILKMD